MKRADATAQIEGKTNLTGRAGHDLYLLIPIVVLLAVGCGTVGKIVSGGGDGGSGGSAPANSAAPPIEVPLHLVQPRVLTYADLQFTATKAVISNRRDDILAADSTKPEIADITFEVVNTLKEGVRVEGGLWQLRLADGSVYKQVYADNLEPRDTKERRASFRVPANAQWTGAQITLNEQDREPATLVLDGPMAPAQFPVAVATQSSETKPKDGTLAYTIIKATLDLDGHGKRAGLNKRYLNLTVRVTDKGPSGGGGYFLPEYFRLIVDGDPLRFEHSSDSLLDAGGTQDYEMTYVVPKNVTMVDLEVGKAGVSQLEKIHLDLEKAGQ